MPSPPTPPSAPNMSSGVLAAWGVAVLVAATVLLGALLPARHGGAPRPVADDPGCLEWTDSCRVCQRRPEGVACSLPGIACQTAEPRCLRRGGG